jgi:predicted phosphoribosyltransferase
VEAHPRFRDRRDAGRSLATRLRPYAGRRDVLVLALPRGGVAVAHEVARALAAPLDVTIVRKLGVPGREELAFGAIGTGGVTVFNDDVIEALQIDRATIDEIIARERVELDRRWLSYRNDRRALRDLRAATLIVVDDGLATGASMLAAIAALRVHEPARIVVAIPVAAMETCDLVRRAADEVVCCWTPEPFGGVGVWYENFPQLKDADVRRFLARR